MDNKSLKIKKIDENSLYNNFAKIGEIILGKKNLDYQNQVLKILFFEQKTLLIELQKKQYIQKLGYENNSYPYLNRFFGISFYF